MLRPTVSFAQTADEDPLPAGAVARLGSLRYRLAKLIADLSSEQFAIRQKAMKELEGFEKLAEAALLKARESGPLETGRRIEQLLGRFHNPSCALLRDLRAIEVLETVGTLETRKVLARLAKGDPAGWKTQEARTALERLDRKLASAKVPH